MQKVTGKISHLILAGLSCLGQTRVTTAQLEGTGTSPRLVWSRGFSGQRVNLTQVKAGAPTVTVSKRIYYVSGDEACSGWVRDEEGGLLYFGWLRGRVVVLAGYNSSTGYIPTARVLNGGCAYADFEEGRYPSGMNGLFYFGVVGMPTTAQKDIKGAAIDELPTTYSMDPQGLTSVSLIGGRIVKPEESK